MHYGDSSGLHVFEVSDCIVGNRQQLTIQQSLRSRSENDRGRNMTKVSSERRCVMSREKTRQKGTARHKGRRQKAMTMMNEGNLLVAKGREEKFHEDGWRSGGGETRKEDWKEKKKRG